MTTTLEAPASRDRKLEKIAERLRRDSLVATSEAGSGHPTSCMSCAEIMSVLFFERMRLDRDQPDNPHNDQFVLSKGHAAPILWSVLHQGGLIDDDDLRSLRRVDSEFEGHPTPRNEWVRVATGSLGQGLSMGAGMAWTASRRGSDSRVYVLLGDGETAEGSVWEAAATAPRLGLGNLTAIIDINRFGQSEATMLGHELKSYRKRFEAFGWRVEEIDGHSVRAVSEALGKTDGSEQPTAILAKTIKGRGVRELEGIAGSHGKPADSLEDALAQLDPEALEEDVRSEFQRPETSTAGDRPARDLKLPAGEVEIGSGIATRQAFGDAMLDLGEACERLVALDGDVKNSTKLEPFFDKFPERAIECFIAEQNMVGMAVGIDKAGMLPCVATFAAFLTRAFDQFRMAAVSRARLIVAGSHCGVAIGQDGPSQMGLEDLAMMRALPGSLVLHPGDAVATRAALEQAANHDGISYLRLTRNKLPVIYENDRSFAPGEAPVHGETADDRVTLVGAGVTLHECLRAQEALAEEGIPARVVDCFRIKPIDADTLCRCAEETGRMVVVEDHYEAGGLGEAVLSALGGRGVALRHLAVREVSRSGAPAALLDRHGISSDHIAAAARELAA